MPPGLDLPVESLHCERYAAKIIIDRPPEKFNGHAECAPDGPCPDLSRAILSVNGLNRLQEDRVSEITHRSLITALLWEWGQLQDTRIAWVINSDGLDCFQVDDKEFEAMLSKTFKAFAQDGTIQYRYLLNAWTKGAEYIFWPYQFRYPDNARISPESEGRWVVIVIRVEKMPISLGEKKQVEAIATDIVVVDPVDEGRKERYDAIQKRLPMILIENFIEVAEDCWDADGAPRIKIKSIGAEEYWATGHVCYAVLHELFRRIRWILTIGNRGMQTPEFWHDFAEDYNHDCARMLMMNACTQTALEQTKYWGRVAIEIPGYDNNKLPEENYFSETVSSVPAEEDEDEAAKAAREDRRYMERVQRAFGGTRQFLPKETNKGQV